MTTRAVLAVAVLSCMTLFSTAPAAAAGLSASAGLTSSVAFFTSAVTNFSATASSNTLITLNANTADVKLARKASSQTYLEVKVGSVYEVDSSGAKISQNQITPFGAQALASSSAGACIRDAANRLLGSKTTAVRRFVSRLFGLLAVMCACVSCLPLSDGLSGNYQTLHAGYKHVSQPLTGSLGA
jgi:hypothetical protein